MADNNDTIIRVKTEADNSGAKSAEKAIDKVGDAADRAGKQAKSAGDKATDSAKKATSSADKATSSAEKATSAFGRLGSAVKGFTKALGYIGLAMRTIEMLVDAFNKVKDWLDRDKRAAEKFARAVQDAKNMAAVEASAAAYEKLNAKIAEAVRLENERDRNAAKRLSIERAAEDARTELDMQKELAGLDRNDPEYAGKAELVRSKYARIRAQRAADRASRDLNAQQAGLYAKADANEERAQEYEKDVYGKSGDAVISLKNQIFSEKDPERKKNLEAQLDKLLAEQQKKLAEIKKLRDEAESMRKEAASLMGGDTAALITAKAVGVQQDAADADTRRRMDESRRARAEAERKAAEDAAADAAKRADDERKAKAKAAAEAAKRADDEKTVAEGTAKISELEASASSERARAQAAADAYAREGADVVAAQNRYDMLVTNGGSRKERSAALAALQKEQAEAQETKFEMEKVAAEVAGTLQAITAQIKALSSAVQKAQGRLSQNQADAPEG